MKVGAARVRSLWPNSSSMGVLVATGLVVTLKSLTESKEDIDELSHVTA